MPGSAPGGCRIAADSRAAPEYIERFSAGSRALHWSYALPFVALILTGLGMLIPEAKGVAVGGSRLVPALHIAAGFFLLAGPPLTYLGASDRGLVHRDAARIARFGLRDVRWLAWAGKATIGFQRREPAAGKFNAGQKLNSAFTVATGAALAATGVALTIHSVRKGIFDVDLAQRIFTLHGLLAYAAMPVVGVHIYLATVNPGTREALRGITKGIVRRDWASRHHPGWVADEDGKGLP